MTAELAPATVRPGGRVGPLTGPTCKATGVVLERREWSEASQILTLFTAEFGRLKALAKGARRPRSRHGGGVDVLDVVSVVLYPRERGLHLVGELMLAPVQPARPLRRRLSSLLAGFAAAETVREGAAEHEPAPALYDDLVTTLAALGSAARPSLVLAAFEWRCLAATGDAPSLDACAACGAPMPSGPVAFAVAAGGACCRDCRPEAPGPVRTLPAEARAGLVAIRDGGEPAPERPQGAADGADTLPPRALRSARAALAAVFRCLHGRARRCDRLAALIEAAPPVPPRVA